MIYFFGLFILLEYKVLINEMLSNTKDLLFEGNSNWLSISLNLAIKGYNISGKIHFSGKKPFVKRV